MHVCPLPKLHTAIDLHKDNIFEDDADEQIFEHRKFDFVENQMIIGFFQL